MKLPEAIKILEIHNKWRHRDDLEMTSPKKLGEATDLAVEILKAIEDPWISVEETLRKELTDFENFCRQKHWDGAYNFYEYLDFYVKKKF